MKPLKSSERKKLLLSTVALLYRYVHSYLRPYRAFRTAYSRTVHSTAYARPTESLAG